MPTRNEAGTSTRALRRARLEETKKMAVELGEGDPDRTLVFVVVGLTVGGDGKLEARRSLVVYGEQALEWLVKEMEESLGQIAAHFREAREAAKVSRVKGRKGGDA